MYLLGVAVLLIWEQLLSGWKPARPNPGQFAVPFLPHLFSFHLNLQRVSLIRAGCEMTFSGTLAKHSWGVPHFQRYILSYFLLLWSSDSLCWHAESEECSRMFGFFQSSSYNIRMPTSASLLSIKWRESRLLVLLVVVVTRLQQTHFIT